MRNKQIVLLLIVSVFLTLGAIAQNHRYYVRTITNEFNPKIIEGEKSLRYIGDDGILRALFTDQEIYVFKNVFTSSNSSALQRTFYIESDSENLVKKFIVTNSHIFEFAEYAGNQHPELSAFPNDYGQNGGSNQGLNWNLSGYDYSGVPIAWDYTTGDANIER